MPDPQQTLTQRFQDAIVAAFGEEYADTDPLIAPSRNPKFGDYQANVAMSLAKKVGQKPRDVAQAVIDKLEVADLAESPDIAGPGFINLRLTGDFVDSQVTSLSQDARLGVPEASPAQRVVVDYSSPNVAKEMHVGHLRSTIIGDAIARTLSFQGHDVIRQNHIGDWGTQFGMLIEHAFDQGISLSGGQAIDFAGLTALYRDAKVRFDAEAEFAERAKKRVVALQAGDDQTLQAWRHLTELSQRYFLTVYESLGVLLTLEDVQGESAYNDHLADTVAALEKADLLEESQGAKVVYPDRAQFKDKEGEPLPMIVQKSDGGFLYATTDLAAARYRINDLNANRVIYVTDSRQRDHFAMVFKTLEVAGWQDDVRLDHVPFGTVMGPDGKPFKTRSGETVALSGLIHEAVERAEAVIREKNPDMPEAQRNAVARAVGIGALKYADLSTDRVKDYVFDFDRMLALDGNTAPYLQYSYVRIQSIFRKGGVDAAALAGQSVTLTEPAEKALALKVMQLPAVVDAVADSLEPHRMCNYLYELASAFHKFFEQCRVLDVGDDTVKASRLVLCKVTAETLAKGLELLGINVVDQM